MAQKTETIGDVLVAYLRENNLEKPLLERELIKRWPEIMGPAVAQLTRSVEMEDGMLRVRISSAALRATLFDERRQLIERLNSAMGATVVLDIRLLG